MFLTPQVMSSSLVVSCFILSNRLTVQTIENNDNISIVGFGIFLKSGCSKVMLASIKETGNDN